jgi:hypothetical protein
MHSLLMMNSQFILDQAERFAQRLPVSWICASGTRDLGGKRKRPDTKSGLFTHAHLRTKCAKT